jgi:hypothetical protein
MIEIEQYTKISANLLEKRLNTFSALTNSDRSRSLSESSGKMKLPR